MCVAVYGLGYGSHRWQIEASDPAGRLGIRATRNSFVAFAPSVNHRDGLRSRPEPDPWPEVFRDGLPEYGTDVCDRL